MTDVAPVPVAFTQQSAPVVANLRGWLDTCDYRLCESLDQLDDYCAKVTPAYGLGTDFETNTVNVFSPTLRIVGLNLTRAQGSGLYVPVGHMTGYERNLPLEKVVERMQALDAAAIPGLYYHYQFDGEVWLRVLGWEPTHVEEVKFAVNLHDNSQKSFGLKAAARRILGIEMPSYGETVGTVEDTDEPRTFDQLDPAEAVIYGCSDADGTARLWHHPGVRASVQAQRVVYQLEMKLLPVFRRMLRNGVWLDDARFAALEADLTADIETRRAKILAEVGNININSPDQLAPALQAIGVVMTEMTKGGKDKTNKKFSTAKETLERLAQQPNAPLALREVVLLRRSQAYLTNYVKKCREAYAHFGAHVHFPFTQIGAPTGRMSAGGEKARKGRPKYEKGFVDMNIQSFPNPKKDKDAPDLRSAIVPDDPLCPDLGPDPEHPDPWVVLAIDFSQMQLRIAANIAREPAWIDAFLKGVDIHVRNAQLIFQDPTIRKDDEVARAKGKTSSFAVLFLATDETVALQAGVPTDQATKMMKAFWDAVPRLRDCIASVQALAAREKSVTTFLGRRRPLHEFYVDKQQKGAKWLAEKGGREAWNTKVQGGEAELFKLANVKIDQLITQRGWHDRLQVMLFVHDESVFRCRQSLLAEAVPALQAAASSIVVTGWPVPMTTDAEVGPNWGKALQTWVSSGTSQHQPVPVDTRSHPPSATPEVPLSTPVQQVTDTSPRIAPVLAHSPAGSLDQPVTPPPGLPVMPCPVLRGRRV